MNRFITLTSQKIAKLTIRNEMQALRNSPTFSVTAPAFCAASSVASCGPFSVTKMLLKSMPPASRPSSGVNTSLTRLLTTRVNAAPMMMPTARSTTLPRMMKARNSDTQPGVWQMDRWLHLAPFRVGAPVLPDCGATPARQHTLGVLRCI